MLVPLVSHPAYSFAFPGKHRFPMEKFELLFEYLKEKNIARQDNVFRPGRINPALLKLAHCAKYIDRFLTNTLQKNELKNLGLPWSEELLRRSLISPNGTLLTAKLALKKGVACHLAGGTHHAFYNRPSGFCVFNDLAVAAMTLLRQQQIERILIFDCDVHQGDGTASILTKEVNANTVSIHCERNFPVEKQLSDWDVALPQGTKDDEYLSILVEVLKKAINKFKPQLLLYDAGVDIFEGDPLGRLNISLEGIRERDRRVLSYCKKKAIPIATVIGGGYDDDRQALARRHAIVIEEAVSLWSAEV